MRLTVDKDSISKLEAIRLFYNLRAAFKREVQVRISARRNVHYKIHGLNLTFEKTLELREMLGDDLVRVNLDRDRVKKPKQILWTVKEDDYAGNWKTEIFNIL